MPCLAGNKISKIVYYIIYSGIKNRKDSQEIWAKLAVVPSYIQNQFFFSVHQNVNKPKNRTAKAVYGPTL